MLRDNKNNPVTNTAENIKIIISRIENFIYFSLSLDGVVNIHNSFNIRVSHLFKTDVASVVST